ncbi:UV DNA damage repair endonuclease UvsE [Desulfobulbus alkaliphilus]|uniref:UV DNA damage repair endonuclease UvsE n=1 Tax=Desulfobulbus alkaliphilus TaxID=869814 RepID=UPI001F054C89|nr:UV DNA damage repair endonuclease UvsE [Desulfobulbus alkaliphilus]
MRLGLCCLFKEEPISFRTTTARALSTLPRGEQLRKLSHICRNNAENLLRAVDTVARLGIGAFRIMSPLFPRMTHPEVGYSLDQLPDGQGIAQVLTTVRDTAQKKNIRLSFHPDQFVVLPSPHPAVVASSIQELEYQGRLAAAVGADVINIHVGGVYGDKGQALERFARVFAQLSDNVRSRLTLENDDVSYTVTDLLPLCRQLSIPLVYDVHHHRCKPDGLSVEEATRLAESTWQGSGREQYCHLSSPKFGWKGTYPKAHADYIDPADIPSCWLGRAMTVDVEAKAKELAVLRLMADLQQKRLDKIVPGSSEVGDAGGGVTLNR